MNFRATVKKFAKPDARPRPQPGLVLAVGLRQPAAELPGRLQPLEHPRCVALGRQAAGTSARSRAADVDRYGAVPARPARRSRLRARVYFYNREQKEPMEVDGQLIVYAFDATKQQGGIPVPEKKYVFTADQLPSHHSKTEMGHSYSVWLPWDEIGGPSRHVTLITRFEGRESGVVVSDPVHKMLPGVPRAGACRRRINARCRRHFVRTGRLVPVGTANRLRRPSRIHHDRRDARVCATLGTRNGGQHGAVRTGSDRPSRGTADARVQVIANRRTRCDGTVRRGTDDRSGAAQRSAGTGGGGGKGDTAVSPATCRSFCTSQIPGSKLVRIAARSRAAAEGTVPRKVAVWPATHTSTSLPVALSRRLNSSCNVTAAGCR